MRIQAKSSSTSLPCTNAPSLPDLYPRRMRNQLDIGLPNTQPEPESVLRLLTALGDWGEAEEQGVPTPLLDQLAYRALDAYEDIAAAA